MNEKSSGGQVSLNASLPVLRFPFAALILWGTVLGGLNLLLGLATQRLLIHFSGAPASSQMHITLLLGVFTLTLLLALLPAFLAGAVVTWRTHTNAQRDGGIAGAWCGLIATLLNLLMNQALHQHISWSDTLALLMLEMLSGFLAGAIGGRYRLWHERWRQKAIPAAIPVEDIDTAHMPAFPPNAQRPAAIEDMDTARIKTVAPKYPETLIYRWWGRWRNWWTQPDVSTALAVTLTLRVFCSLIAFLAHTIAPEPYVLVGEVFLRYFQTFAHTPPPFSAAGWIGYLGAGWRKWDTAWYTGIAAAGYTTYGMTAFLPLYPVLIGIVGRALLENNLTVAALLISTVCCFGTFLSLYRLVERLSTVPGTARRMVFLAAALPVSLFLVAGYTEALFLWATFSAMLAFSHQQWGKMALFAIIASLTRHQGPLLSLLLVPTVLDIGKHWLSECWHIRKVVRELRGPLLAALAGPVVYLGWAGIVLWVLHQPLPWVSLQQWHLHYALPGTGIFADLLALAHPNRTSALGLPGDALDAGAALLSAAIIMLSIRRVPPALTIFAVGIWCMALFKVEPDGETMSAARYLLPMLPVAVGIVEKLVRSHPAFQLALMMLGSLTVLFCTWYFVLGLWVN